MTVFAATSVGHGAPFVERRYIFKRPEGLNMESKSQLSCFVISPIGDKSSPIGSTARQVWERNIETWEEVILPACVGVGLGPIRADQISEAGEITDQIFRHLRDSHVVIADLTGANPNVMYELGLRHTTGKLTIQIGEIGQLPFDVAMIRTIQFQRTAGGLIAARRALAEALAAGIEGRFTPTSATRIWLELPISLEDPSTDSLSEDVEEDGFLEMLAKLSVARDEMTATLGAMGNVISEIGAMTSEATAEIARAGGPSASFEQKIAISNALAKNISDPAGRLEALATAFADSISKSDPGTRYLIDRLKENQDSESVTALSSLVGYFRTILAGFDSAASYRSSLGGKMPTKAQGAQYRRITSALDRQLSTRPVVEGWIAAAN